MIKGAPKGPGKRKLEPQATDNPEKYVGKWEEYDSPQGINSGQAFRKKKVAEFRFSVDEDMNPAYQTRWTPDTALPDEIAWDGKSVADVPNGQVANPGFPAQRKPPLKQVYRDVEKMRGISEARLVELTQQALRRPLPYEWTMDEENTAIAEFYTRERILFLVYFVNLGKKERYELSFEQADTDFDDPEQIQPVGNIYEVLATVIAIAKDFLIERKPWDLMFTAAGPMRNKLNKLYPILIRLAAPEFSKLGYVDNSGGGIFIISARENPVAEAIRRTRPGTLTGEYEVKDGKSVVGKARVEDGVIQVLSTHSDRLEAYRGQVMSRLLETIIREADMRNANLSIQVLPEQGVKIRRMLERFGFRHIGANVYQRRAGSIKAFRVPESA